VGDVRLRTRRKVVHAHDRVTGEKQALAQVRATRASKRAGSRSAHTTSWPNLASTTAVGSPT
jgi:hypothetical protein